MSTMDLSTKLANLTTEIAISTIDKVRHRQSAIAMSGIKARMKADLRDDTIAKLFRERLGNGNFFTRPGSPLEGSFLDNGVRHETYVDGVSLEISNTISEVLSTGTDILDKFRDILREKTSNDCFTKVVNPDHFFDIQIVEHCPLLQTSAIARALSKVTKDTYFKEGFQYDETPSLEVEEHNRNNTSDEDRFLAYFDLGEEDVLDGLVRMARVFDLTIDKFEKILVSASGTYTMFRDGILKQANVAAFTRGYEEALVCLIYYLKKAKFAEEGDYRYSDLALYWTTVLIDILTEYQRFIDLGYVFNPISSPEGFVNKDFDFIGVERLTIPVFEENLSALYAIEGSSGFETIFGLVIDKQISPFVKISDLQETGLHRFGEHWLEFRSGFGEKQKENLNFLLETLYVEVLEDTLRTFQTETPPEAVGRVKELVELGITHQWDQETLNDMVVGSVILDSPVAVRIFQVLKGTDRSDINGDDLRGAIIEIVADFCMGMVDVSEVNHG